MDSLPDGLLLEFHPDTLQAVRKEFNLDKPGRLEEAINILEDWVKKQNHFLKKDFSRDYLERTIISTKGLVERSKIRMDKLCTFKTLLPDFFTETDVDTLEDLKGLVAHADLPKLTEDHRRVYFLKILTDLKESSSIFKYYKYTIMLSEYLKKQEYSNGFIIVLDCTNCSIMNLITKINVIELHQALTIVMEGYGMRVKGIHIITPSKMVDALVSLFKSVLSEKLSGRIHTHKTVDTVYEHVPRDILPLEYGGKERSLTSLNEEWFKVIASKEHQEYLKEMSQAKTDQSCRQTDKFNEDYIGMPGSFRSLNVD